MSALVLVAGTLLCGIGSVFAAHNQPSSTVPALLQVVKSNRYAALSVLLKRGVNVEVRDETGRTALMWAAYQSDFKKVSTLLRHRAKVNAQDNDGLTALWIATERGDIAISTGAEVEIVRQLLRYGAKVNLKDKHGETVFGLIAQMERPDPKIVRLLKQARARQQRHKASTDYRRGPRGQRERDR